MVRAYASPVFRATGSTSPVCRLIRPNLECQIYELSFRRGRLNRCGGLAMIRLALSVYLLGGTICAQDTSPADLLKNAGGARGAPDRIRDRPAAVRRTASSGRQGSASRSDDCARGGVGWQSWGILTSVRWHWMLPDELRDGFCRYRRWEQSQGSLCLT